MRRIALSLLLLPALTACGPAFYPLGVCQPRHGHSHHGAASALGAALEVTALVVEIAAFDRVMAEQAPRPERVEKVASSGDAPVVLPPSPHDAIPPGEARPFDGVAARASLGRMDLAGCRDEGAPRGFVHAKVAFGVDGRVTRVLIDGPEGLSEEAVTCIGARLAEARVDRFAGRAAEVGFQAFVP